MRTRVIALAVLIVAVVGALTFFPTEPTNAPYDNCTQARAAGPTPIREGTDGYAPHLDADRDGLACE